MTPLLWKQNLIFRYLQNVSILEFLCCYYVTRVLTIPLISINVSITIIIKFSFIWRRNIPSDTNAKGIYKCKLMTKNQLITTYISVSFTQIINI